MLTVVAGCNVWIEQFYSPPGIPANNSIFERPTPGHCRGWYFLKTTGKYLIYPRGKLSKSRPASSTLKADPSTIPLPISLHLSLAMSQSARLIEVCIIILFSFATASQYANFGSSTRTFLSTGTKMASDFSVTQIRNPNWKPYNTTTTALYAAGFLKHNRPMPPALKAAWDDLLSHESLGSPSSIESRDSGQVVPGTEGL